MLFNIIILELPRPREEYFVFKFLEAVLSVGFLPYKISVLSDMQDGWWCEYYPESKGLSNVI